MERSAVPEVERGRPAMRSPRREALDGRSGGRDPVRVLLPSDMFPLLCNEDPEVRLFVAEYFEQGHEPVPASADDLWVLSDRVQPADRLCFLRHLPRLPSTPYSRDRLFHALRTETDDDIYAHLRGPLERLPADDLRRALGDRRIARRMPPNARAALHHVLALADQSFEALWTIVETCPVDTQGRLVLLQPKASEADRLALSVARFPEPAARRALDALLRPAAGERALWEQAFAARLFRHVRHPGAVAPLSAMLGSRKLAFAFASRWAADALVHQGTPEVVAGLSAAFLRGGRRFGMNAAGVLGRIKRPESERAVLDLLDVTTDMLVRFPLGVALCELCPTEPAALDRIHDLVCTDHVDPRRSSLEEQFLALCALQGFQPIEAVAWRARQAAREAAWEAGEDESAEGGGIDPFLLELLRGEPERDLN